MPVTAGAHRAEINLTLGSALQLASSGATIDLPADVKDWVRSFSEHIDQQATSAFNNILTCLTARAVNPHCDPRYHRQPGKGMAKPPNGCTFFAGRLISESIMYPWLREQGFRGAMSGWQTRVFERPQPYLLDYSEHIAHVRTEFLSILDAVATGRAEAIFVLAEFFRLEIEEQARHQSAVHRVSKHTARSGITIDQVIVALGQHFSLPNAARLPVLAVQALYKVLLPRVSRYNGMTLALLSEHSAADENTGAIGDIEVLDGDMDVYEAIEVKHNILISDTIVKRAYDKICSSSVSRYYILSTSPSTRVSDSSKDLIENLRMTHGCQIVLNGVLPTIKYFLRLLDDLSEFIDAYGELLTLDRRVTREQLEAWPSIASDLLESSSYVSPS